MSDFHYKVFSLLCLAPQSYRPRYDYVPCLELEKWCELLATFSPRLWTEPCIFGREIKIILRTEPCIFVREIKIILWTGPWVFFRETKFSCGLDHGSFSWDKIFLWTESWVFFREKSSPVDWTIGLSRDKNSPVLRTHWKSNTASQRSVKGGGGEMPLSYFPFLSGFPASCKTRLSIYREFHVLLWTWNVNSVPRKLRTIRLLINRKLRCWFRISSHFCWWKQRNARWCAKRTLNT